jgi:hypothetical protein
VYLHLSSCGDIIDSVGYAQRSISNAMGVSVSSGIQTISDLQTRYAIPLLDAFLT